VFKRLRETAKAKEALDQGRAIVERLTTLSPDHAEWKRDLARIERQIVELPTQPMPDEFASMPEERKSGRFARWLRGKRR
jgi:hypothetical protein